MSNLITKQELVDLMPTTLKSNITDNIVDMLNTATSNPEELKNIRENFISYSSVMRDGKYSLQEYLNAVKYVSFKLLDHTNQEAYIRTFPDRYSNLLARGATAKDVASYVHAYNKGKLVNAIWEQSLVEPWVLYNDKYGMAVEALVNIISDPSASNRDKAFSANSLLANLKKPEVAATVQVNLGTGIAEDTLDKLDKALDKLSTLQQNSIGNGSSAKEIAESNIIEGEYKDG